MPNDNSSNKKRNITGSYPGVTGSYKPQSRNIIFDDIKKPDTVSSDTIITPAVKNTDSVTSDTIVSPKVSSDTIVTPNIRKQASDKTRIIEETIISDPVNVHKTKKSETIKKEIYPKKNFNWKMWFSQENVKGYMKHVRFYGICVLVALFLTFGIVNISNDIFAFIKPDENIVVTIPEGSTTPAISKILKESGVIKHPTVFALYSKFIKKADGKFQFGDYTLNSRLDYNQIISKLKRTSAQAEMLKLTIPEGATQDDITEILTAGKYANITELDSALNSYDYEKFEFVRNLPDRRCRLEGYLPAGDYEIAKGESAISIVSKMLERFEQTVLTEENKLLIEKTGKSLDEIITTASLVYAECDNADSYKTVASVLANRLSNPVENYLQLTSTINYVLAQSKKVLNSDDKLTDSSYNTYIYTGLPTGPVCTPSLAAIQAVINPESSGYMYFISDGTKTTFSVTAEEHKKHLANASETAKGTDVIR